MLNIWIITVRFPYEPGEEFLEKEIYYWAASAHAKVTIFPMEKIGNKRNMPSNIELDECLSDIKYLYKIFYAFFAFFSLRFWKEVGWLIKNNRLKLRSLLRAVKTEALVLLFYYFLKKKSQTCKKPIVGYSYWFDIGSYALCVLKKNQKISRSITRAHGFDLYEERSLDHYMPIKRQLAKYIDKIFVVSDDGREYIIKQLGLDKKNIETSRLGVSCKNIIKKFSSDGNIHIISVSYCVEVKKIDRIIAALHLAARNTKNTIFWNHIGDGPLEEALRQKAKKYLSNYDNINFNFLGKMSNSEVIDYYKRNTVDVFINTSDSEGIPVSIMEAMSFGIPAIAPRVGGIKEIIDNKNGYLLPENFSEEDACNAILDIGHYKNLKTRNNAFNTISEKYNYEKNYEELINKVINDNI